MVKPFRAGVNCPENYQLPYSQYFRAFPDEPDCIQTTGQRTSFFETASICSKVRSLHIESHKYPLNAPTNCCHLWSVSRARLKGSNRYESHDLHASRLVHDLEPSAHPPSRRHGC